MTLHRRYTLGALTLALGLLLAFAGTVAAHTGSLKASQDCAGYSISAHLDSNVAASATWTLKLNGNLIANGTGPGPADLGPYTGPVTTGTVTFRIAFGQEVNKYEATLYAPEGCTQPTPTPTPPVIPCTPANNCTTPPLATPTPVPTPVVTPTPEPSPTPEVTAPPVTPEPTLPPTDGVNGTPSAPDGVAVGLLVLFVVVILAAVPAHRVRQR